MHLTFHPLPRLPLELRLAIWRLCLPERVYELDLPESDYVFHVPYELTMANRRVPCDLDLTSTFNTLPPVITRVCRESRQVALETGSYVSQPDSPPREELWARKPGRPNTWIDRKYDSAHLSWYIAYQDDFTETVEGHEKPGRSLAAAATYLNGAPSLTMNYFYWGYQWTKSMPMIGKTSIGFDLTDVLGQQCVWRVVMHTIVVHDASGKVASSGFFGLLGDAPIQVVDVDDHKRMDTFYKLAEDHERTADAIVPRQSFLRRTPKDVDGDLTKYVYDLHGIDRTKLKLRPAVMFRLCPLMCNHTHEVRDVLDLLSPRSESAMQMRGRGDRGRGRGRGRGLG